MSAHEWALSSRSVWNDVSSARKDKHLLHGATFPEKLADRVIKMYFHEGDVVLDPFLGTGTTLLASKYLSRNSYGTDVNHIAILISQFKVLDLSKKIYDNLEKFIDNFSKTYIESSEKTDLFFYPLFVIVVIEVLFESHVIL